MVPKMQISLQCCLTGRTTNKARALNQLLCSASSTSSSSSLEAASSSQPSEDSQPSSSANKNWCFFLSLDNTQTLYTATLKVGSPAQEVQVMIDTGSSDLWFISSGNSQCKVNGGSIDCDKYGVFDKLKSSLHGTITKLITPSVIMTVIRHQVLWVKIILHLLMDF